MIFVVCRLITLIFELCQVALPGITVRSFPDSRPAMLLKASEQGLEKSEL